VGDTTKPRVLCASSDAKRLAAFTRLLGTSVEVEVATSAEQALSRLDRGVPFAVLLATSEVATPAFSGLCRTRHPGLALVVVAPPAEAHTRQDANVFAILDDATSPGDIATTVVIAAEQEAAPPVIAMAPAGPTPSQSPFHPTAELARELHSSASADEAEKDPIGAHTLAAAKALAKLFRLIDGDEYRRSLRYSRHVILILRACKCRPFWPAECAALVRHIGRVSLPVALLDKVDRRTPLASTEKAEIARIPGITRSIIQHLPGAAEVIEVLEQVEYRFDGRVPLGLPTRSGERISAGARALRLAVDYDQAQARGFSHESAMRELRVDAGRYDPLMLDAVDEIETPPPADDMGAWVVKSVDLTAGTVLAEPLRGIDGNVILGDAHTMTERDVVRILALAQEHRIRDTILVMR
jgi:hypothetical protein